MCVYQILKKKDINSAICDNVDISGDHYAKWNKPQRESPVFLRGQYLPEEFPDLPGCSAHPPWFNVEYIPWLFMCSQNEEETGGPSASCINHNPQVSSMMLPPWLLCLWTWSSPKFNFCRNVYISGRHFLLHFVFSRYSSRSQVHQWQFLVF